MVRPILSLMAVLALGLVDAQSSFCTKGATSGLDACVRRVSDRVGTIGRSNYCSAAASMVACKRADAALCYNDPESQRHAINGFTVALAEALTKNLGNSLINSCPVLSQAIDEFYDDIYGGSRACDLGTALDRLGKDVECQSRAKDRFDQALNLGQTIGDSLKTVCDYRDELSGCYSYMPCHSASERSRQLQGVQQSFSNMAGVFREEIPDFSYSEYCPLVQNRRFRRSVAMSKTIEAAALIDGLGGHARSKRDARLEAIEWRVTE